MHLSVHHACVAIVKRPSYYGLRKARRDLKASGVDCSLCRAVCVVESVVWLANVRQFLPRHNECAQTALLVGFGIEGAYLGCQIRYCQPFLDNIFMEGCKVQTHFFRDDKQAAAGGYYGP